MAAGRCLLDQLGRDFLHDRTARASELGDADRGDLGVAFFDAAEHFELLERVVQRGHLRDQTLKFIAHGHLLAVLRDDTLAAFQCVDACGRFEQIEQRAWNSGLESSLCALEPRFSGRERHWRIDVLATFGKERNSHF